MCVTEFKWTAIIAIILLFISIACIPVLSLSSEYRTLAHTVMAIPMIAQHSPSLMSTLLIPYKVNKMREWNKLDSPSALQREVSSGNFKEDLQETLKDEQKCEAFIDWMYREFSSEAILSFLEFVQFKKYVKEEIGKKDGKDVSAETGRFDFEFYDEMPRSTIVYDTWSVSNLDDVVASSLVDVPSLSTVLESNSSAAEDVLIRTRRIAHLLFRKYIDYHSELEINISGPLRNKFVKLDETNYAGMELVQFVTFHDDLIYEMMKYQARSYRRFERVYQQQAESPRSLME